MSEDYMRWWREAKFGMFIHWGLYAILGRGEWVMNDEGIPPEEYRKLAQEFSPRYCDIRQWVKLAREAGMRYVVFTAKHHDGFCMWNTATTEYNSIKSAAQRDFVMEYVEACRAEGLKVGIYFSLIDWNHPDGDMRGMRDIEARTRYVRLVIDQVRELCTNYGKIDILWYDGCFFKNAGQYYWRDSGLNEMVRQLQPGIIINDRSDTKEDFGTPEQQIKPDPEGKDWEACITLNGSWGYYRGAEDWKSTEEVITMLGECARSGGNLLLNIGPDSDGIVPTESVRVLREVGQWLQRNGEAVYNTKIGKVGFGGYYGPKTVSGNNLYIWTKYWTGSQFCISKLHCKVKKALLLNGNIPVEFEQKGDRLFLNNLPENPPDYPYTVLKLEIDGEPYHISGPGLDPHSAWADFNM